MFIVGKSLCVAVLYKIIDFGKYVKNEIAVTHKMKCFTNEKGKEKITKTTEKYSKIK
jgi:hypothetical protein